MFLRFRKCCKRAWSTNILAWGMITPTQTTDSMWLFFLTAVLLYVIFNLSKKSEYAEFDQMQENAIISTLEEFSGQCLICDPAPKLRYSSILLVLKESVRENLYQVSPVVKLEQTERGRKFIWFFVCLVKDKGVEKGMELLTRVIEKSEVVPVGKTPSWMVPSTSYLQRTFKNIDTRYRMLVYLPTDWREMLREPNLEKHQLIETRG